MTRADRELLLSLHAKVDALLARSEPDIDRYDGALVKLLHDSFDTDQFTRRDVIERADYLSGAHPSTARLRRGREIRYRHARTEGSPAAHEGRAGFPQDTDGPAWKQSADSVTQ